MPFAVARQYLEDKKAREFDPACVEAFLSRWDDVAEICTARRANPEPGIPTATAPLENRVSVPV